jgi:UDP-N-acetylmuramoyl-L-alanyl-D-glutamate--2,6-diaminopimelate ligase
MKVKHLSELIRSEYLLQPQKIEDCLIKKIVYNSGQVEAMSLFVAIKGFSSDGHTYLQEARDKGAAAAIVETVDPAVNLAQYRVRSSREILALLAARFYSPEVELMRLAAVTGTNGKTTTSFLMRSVFESAGLHSGLLGTIHYHIGNKQVKAWNTTPESVDLFRMLYEMSLSGQNGCVLEASSHGLALHRLDCLKFEVAVFTNLSQDHLDFHKDFEDYYQSKKLLFNHLKNGGHAVINRDDSFGRRLIDEITVEIFDYSMSTPATVRASEWSTSLRGSNCDIVTPQGKTHIVSPLIGDFNVENILAAFAAGLAMNFDLKTIKNGIENVQRIPGRLETVDIGQEKTVIVDYSHTPDALQKALHVLRPLTPKKLWVVFGCGGDRDKKKRPLMGSIAADFADRVIITSDNPRNEPPAAIIDDIMNGINNPGHVMVEENRRKAIKLALSQSKAGDTILVAGKGHEDYQEIKGLKHPFDDRKVILEAVS